jgi:hypothetical protein
MRPDGGLGATKGTGRGGASLEAGTGEISTPEVG